MTKEQMNVLNRDLERMLQTAPKEAFSIWIKLGNVKRRLGNSIEALKCYDSAHKISKEDYRPYVARARIYEEIGMYSHAAWNYQRAITVSKNNFLLEFEIHFKMATFRMEQGKNELALESFRQAEYIYKLLGNQLSQDKMYNLYLNMAEVMLRLNLYDEAYEYLKMTSGSESLEILNALAETAFRFNLWHESIEVLKKTIDLMPNEPSTYYNLAKLQSDVWMIEDALLTLEKAKFLGFSYDLRTLEASIHSKAGNNEDAFLIYHSLAQENQLFASSAAMCTLYTDQLSAQEKAEIHCSMFQRYEKKQSKITTTNDFDPSKPLKIGFITADLHHQHPINIFMQPLLKEWDNNNLYTVIYFTGVSYDLQTQLAKNRADQWHEMSQATEDQFRQQVKEDKIDVLIDLSGHTHHNRIQFLANRLAPIQVSFLGYPHTTGASNIDYIIGDPIVTPLKDQKLYSEKIIQLPHCVFCYAPEEDYPFPSFDSNYLSRQLTFGSFNNAMKLNKKTMQVWSEILKNVPHSRLVLKSPSFLDQSAREKIQMIFVDFGIEKSRIECRGPSSLRDMMKEYEDIDIALDPFPYNGGTTTLQAMWMGVPVVVKEGDNFVSRMGSSFMNNAGLHEWVAKTDIGYIAIASKMAKNRNTLLHVKKNMRKTLSYKPGWDIKEYSQNFQEILRKM